MKNYASLSQFKEPPRLRDSLENETLRKNLEHGDLEEGGGSIINL
jgi:hypothetical protein